MAAEKLRVLYLAASPSGGPADQEIDLDADYDAIHEAIDAAGGTDRFEFSRVWGVRAKDLVDQLSVWRPHVVHFSGHGARGAGLVLTDDRGGAALATAAGLTGLFKAARRDDLRLVVLMSCYGLPLARALAPHVKVAIGVEDAIEDGMATDFNRAFYAALASGRSLREAYDQGYAMARLTPGTHARNRPELAAGPHADLDVTLIPAQPLTAVVAPIPAVQSAKDAGLRCLDLRLYEEAIGHFREAVHRSSDDADAHYCLALALLRGRRPERIATLKDALDIQRLLHASTTLAPRAHAYYLWAWIRSDYHVRRRVLAHEPPTVDALLATAVASPQDVQQLRRLATHLPFGTADVALQALQSAVGSVNRLTRE